MAVRRAPEGLTYTLLATACQPSGREKRELPMADDDKIPVFISFDYDHDTTLKEFLVGQAKNEDSPFSIADRSIKDESDDWKDKARTRIKRADQVIVICGNTRTRRRASMLKSRSPVRRRRRTSC